MRKLLMFALAAAVIGTLAATALAATSTIKVGDNYYVRSKGVPTVTVKKGDKLRFRFTGIEHHNAKGKGISLGSSCSKLRDSGTCTSSALNKKGTFVIYCSNHEQADQSMKVKVR